MKSLLTPLLLCVGVCVSAASGQSTPRTAPSSNLPASAPGQAISSSQGTSGKAELSTTAPHGQEASCDALSWDSTSNLVCSQGAFSLPAEAAKSAVGYGLHSLGYTGAEASAGTNRSAMARVFFTADAGTPVGEQVGWNANPLNDPFADAKHDLALSVSNTGFSVAIGATDTTVWKATGNASGIPGLTDSGNGDGWGAPVSALYNVGLFVPDTTDVIFTASLPGTLANDMAARVHFTNLPACASPCGAIGTGAGLQNFFIKVAHAADRISRISEGEPSLPGGPALSIPTTGVPADTGVLLPFAMHADGTESTYDGDCASNQCVDIFVYLSPGYRAGKPERWVLHFSGANQTPVYSSQVTMDPANVGGRLADTLNAAGYSWVAVENPSGANGRNCYGAPLCTRNAAQVLALVHRHFAGFASQPFLVADSQGCNTMLNAVAQGQLSPPAMAGYSCNTSLYWAAFNTSANSAHQEQYIARSFGYDDTGCKVEAVTSPDQLAGNCLQYTTGTAGFDPLVSAQTKGSVQQARLAAVPTLLVADPSDPVVDTNANGTFYFVAINNVHPGAVTADFNHLGQGHVGAGLMNGTQLLQFFNAH